MLNHTEKGSGHMTSHEIVPREDPHNTKMILALIEALRPTEKEV